MRGTQNHLFIVMCLCIVHYKEWVSILSACVYIDNNFIQNISANLKMCSQIYYYLIKSV